VSVVGWQVLMWLSVALTGSVALNVRLLHYDPYRDRNR